MMEFAFEWIKNIIHVQGDAVSPFPNKLWFLLVCSITLLKTLWGKEEIARQEQFLLFPQRFVIVLENFLPFSSNLKLSSANPFSLVASEICRLGKCSPAFLQFYQNVFKRLILPGSLKSGSCGNV